MPKLPPTNFDPKMVSMMRSALDAAVDQQRQQLHDVEVVDKGVGQLHECAGQQDFSRHRRLGQHGGVTAREVKAPDANSHSEP